MKLDIKKLGLVAIVSLVSSSITAVVIEHREDHMARAMLVAKVKAEAEKKQPPMVGAVQARKGF